MKIAITGATGFVGTGLVAKLNSKNHSLVILTRNPQKAQRLFPIAAYPNLQVIAYKATQSGEWQNAISGCDAVINLAGEAIAERWTPENKKEILESRKLGTQKIVEAISQAESKPTVLINASAIGYYGSSETETFTEDSASGKDFLAQVCREWEAEAKKVQALNVRSVILRFGIVLGNGGALAKMIPPFQLFAGGPIGNGHQWFSWIDRDDLINLIIFALKQSNMQGTFNATSPNPVRMNELCQTLGTVLNRPSWLPVPDFALELLLGEAAQVVLEGQEVLPKATQSMGFEFQYPNLKSSLTKILSVT